MLTVDRIHAGYGKSRVLDGVSLEVPAGTLVALLGGNGTGKSTLLKAIVGLVGLTSGQVRFDGARIDGCPTNRMIGMGMGLVPQGKEVFAGLSVEENLLMGAYHRRRNRTGVADDLERSYVQFPRLRDRRRVAAGLLSGGERQMLTMARALMARPKFLMLDEPSAALAPKMIEEIGRSILRLREQGMTMLLVEQNVSVALELAEKLYVLRDGRIALERRVEPGMDFDELKSYYLGGAKA